MKLYTKISLLFIISFFINGVFGDGHESLIVNEGGSVTLHTHLTELQTVDLIHWTFKGVLIANVNRVFDRDPVYDSDVRFTDRLKMNPQTGDLTITNITSEHTGLYQLEIISEKTETMFQTFSLRVFGEETERVSVNDGGSVTLHTHLTDLHTDDVIEWWFKGDRIARINIEDENSDQFYYPDERFTDRLKMNNQTGDLTITYITSEHIGLYHLVIIRGNIITKTFSLRLSPKVKIVKERDSVSLHIDVTEKQRNEKIHWKIKHNNFPVAEIITENGKISTPFIEERFRDRLKLDDQTGDLIITHMKNEDSGQYEADVTIGNNTHTIHKTFSVTESAGGLSSGAIAGICVSVLLVIAAAAVVVAGVIYQRHRSSNSETQEGSNSASELEAINEKSISFSVVASSVCCSNAHQTHPPSASSLASITAELT
ncbi:carcinoembryonic antigen-related cell adhesion molecule 1-like isoform X1 [Triplophysa dalaica]|uniref:carcinoembryonic antigen-related cell adhesion molecule 1-like isoform X1 n=1 Tax=Triplophysa dalaica TaxID=1582913 RepID=UPI0024DF97A6|nr:carcinoembryonic antigen-related cell adhesion molecule 1-like isoform X1 [Triplophysa dalaica]